MPLYILILAGFGGLTGGFLFLRHVVFAPLSFEVKSIFFVLACVVAFLPLLMNRRAPETLTRADRGVRHALYAVYVFAVLLMALSLGADLICAGGAFAGLWTGRFCLTPGAYNIGLACIAGLITVISLGNGLKVPRVKRVVLASPKITQPLKIAVLSDLHLHRNVAVEKVRGIVERVNATEPDIIVLTGDMIDDTPTAISALIEPFSCLKAPRWFVTGNHEFYIGYHESVDVLNSIGARLLENNGVMIGDVFLAGIPDKTAGAYFGRQADVKQAFEKAPAGTFKVLLSHTPIDVGETPSFDLEIAGHTHGGQVFPFHLLARLGNKYLAGLYRRGTSLIYVSRGAGQWGPQMRFLAPAEITLIELRPTQKPSE